jgi:glycosyltransferase involved in cell wall biosynthesis
VRIGFLLNDLQLSGGVGVVVHHARELALRHDHDVTLVLVREQETPPWDFDGLAHLHVAGIDEVHGQHFDVLVSTWWETAFPLFELSADRHVSFVQSLEDRFYPPGAPERIGAALTQDLPVAFVTEARWIADTLQQLRPDARCHLVRNGIDKQVFASPETLDVRLDAPLRVVIEGNPDVWFKGVREAVAAVGLMREPHHVTLVGTTSDQHLRHAVDRVVGPLTHAQMAQLYAESDVVLKLSRVEGMFGPPLEGFHMGATCVTTPVTGWDEYVEHGWNAMLVDWDDLPGTARQLDLLARDRRLLHFLRTNALETARGWPSWEQAGSFMAGVLAAIHREPPAPPGAGAAQLMADASAALDRHRRDRQERDEFAQLARPVLRLKGDRRVQRTLRIRHHRLARPLLRPLRPFVRRVRSRLLG